MYEVIIFSFILLLWFYPHVEGFTTKLIKDLTKFNGRKPGISGHDQSYLYLLEKIKSLPVNEYYWAPGFTQNFTFRGIPHKNIVFMLPGKYKMPKIILMAHYDHLGPGFPGGNDNASGVFAVLQIAEKMSIIPGYKRLFDVIFILTDGEEYGMSGSKLISYRFPDNNVIINIDTIGGFPYNIIPISNNNNYSGYFIKMANKKKIIVDLIKIKSGRSDITHFLGSNTCIEFGAITKYSQYHTKDDTYENLYINNVLKITDIAGELVEDLCLGNLNIK